MWGMAKLTKKNCDCHKSKLTKVVFVDVIFDPDKYQTGQTKINDMLKKGYEIMRDYETTGGLVMTMGKFEDEK